MPASYRVTVNAPTAARIVLWQTWHRDPRAAQAAPALLRDVARATATANTHPAAIAFLLVLVKYPGERNPRRFRYNVSRSQTIFIPKRRRSRGPTRTTRRRPGIKIGPTGAAQFQQDPSTTPATRYSRGNPGVRMASPVDSRAMGYRRASGIQATGDNGAPAGPSEELIGTVVETAGGIFVKILDILPDGSAVTEGGGSISAAELVAILGAMNSTPTEPAVPGYVWALGAVAALGLVYAAAK